MNRLGRSRASRAAVAAIFGVLILGVALPVQGGRQAICIEPTAKGSRWSWPKGSRVLVFISPEFSIEEGERQAIEGAFHHWEDAGADYRNGSAVTFAFAYGARPAPQPLMFQVKRGSIASGGQARTMMSSNQRGLLTAVCVIDDRVTDPAALANVMAHEIGHTFGLAECDDCPAGTSVMTRFNGNYNDVMSGRNAPSECDDASVRANGGY